MKSRKHRAESKVELNMTPMIDVVFQLLIFFMFTLKPVIHEGQFAVNMSTGGAPTPTEEMIIPPLAINLRADADGELVGIFFGDKQVQNFEQLKIQVQRVAGGAFADDVEAEIHADDPLKYEYLIAAVNALTAANISKINFAGGGGG